ncbi:MAG: hypothetical protein ACTSQJ_18725, partial [Promethearchaeota archaeon]
MLIGFISYNGNNAKSIIKTSENSNDHKVPNSQNILWKPNGTVICNEGMMQQDVDIVSDNSGGAYIVWA